VGHLLNFPGTHEDAIPIVLKNIKLILNKSILGDGIKEYAFSLQT